MKNASKQTKDKPSEKWVNVKVTYAVSRVTNDYVKRWSKLPWGTLCHDSFGK